TTVDALGSLLQQAAPVPPERVVHLGTQPADVADGQGATADTASWVEALKGGGALAGAALPPHGGPLPPRLAVVGRGDASMIARSLAEVRVPALLVGVAWLFTVAAEHLLSEQLELRRHDSEIARASEERAAQAEVRAVELLAQQLL